MPRAATAVLIAAAALAIAVFLSAGALFLRYYRMMNINGSAGAGDGTFDYDDSAISGLASSPATAQPDDPDNPYGTVPSDNTLPGAADTSQIADYDLPAKKGVVNILLIGADHETKYGNSDAIIVVSVNSADKRITLTSIMRDTETYFPGIENGKPAIWLDKISNAHAYGGPALLINAIERNFGIRIANYAEVHFEEFVEVFEVIGGIDITMTGEELAAFNRESDVPLPWDSAGSPVHLDAAQVLSYVRMRHLSGSDFGRTRRHRAVLAAVFDKVKKMNPVQLDRLLTTILPLVETDLSAADCLAYLAKAAGYPDYTVEDFRIPIDGRYTAELGNLCVRGDDRAYTVNAWREQVAGTR